MKEIYPLHNYSNMLSNTGGPSSRVRTEQVRHEYLNNEGDIQSKGFYGLSLPDDVNDFETWLLEMATEEGWSGWEEINLNINLPHQKLLVFNSYNQSQVVLSNKEKLMSAIILSMCNHYCYQPGSNRIFTRNRLQRRIQLMQINLNNFYELD